MRRAILERFRSEHGDKRIATLPREFMVRMLSRKAPAAARNWLKTLGCLRSPSPKASAATTRRKASNCRPSSRTASMRGQRTRLHSSSSAIPSAQRHGSRWRFYWIRRSVGATVNPMGRQHIHSGALHVWQNKTGEQLIVPIYPSLQAVLDKTPCEHMTFGPPSSVSRSRRRASEIGSATAAMKLGLPSDAARTGCARLRPVVWRRREQLHITSLR